MIILNESLTLFNRISEFVKAVGQFHSVIVNLEPLGDVVAIFEQGLRKSSLRGGILFQDAQPSELGFNQKSHQKVKESLLIP